MVLFVERMGICGSSESAEQAQRNAEIERDLKAAKHAMRNEVKMLLLGTTCFMLSYTLPYSPVLSPV